jgi:hypothetical protein
MADESAPQPVHHRRLAVEFFNAVWALLDQRERTAPECDRMVHLAHASRLHWELAGGTPTNLAIGEWQIARVYSVLRRPEPALHHARRCLGITEQAGLTGFQLGSAHEGMARALAVAGERDLEKSHRDRAAAICRELSDPGERATLEADLNTA